MGRKRTSIPSHSPPEESLGRIGNCLCSAIGPSGHGSVGEEIRRPGLNFIFICRGEYVDTLTAWPAVISVENYVSEVVNVDQDVIDIRALSNGLQSLIKEGQPRMGVQVRRYGEIAGISFKELFQTNNRRRFFMSPIRSPESLVKDLLQQPRTAIHTSPHFNKLRLLTMSALGRKRTSPADHIDRRAGQRELATVLIHVRSVDQRTLSVHLVRG